LDFSAGRPILQVSKGGDFDRHRLSGLSTTDRENPEHKKKGQSTPKLKTGEAPSSTGTLACVVFEIVKAGTICVLEGTAAFKTTRARVPVLLERANHTLGLG